jgi:hypothetical protein
LNLLCLLGIMHGRHVAFCRLVHYSHLPSHGPRRSGSRSNRSVAEVVIPADTAIDHATSHPGRLNPQRLPANSSVPLLAAILPARLPLPVPEHTKELVAHENVLALGSAPRAPGLGRAPPVA